MARRGAARLPLAALLLAAAVCRVSARSAAARASASGAGGGGANSGVVTLVSTAVPGPLPPAMQAAADAVFSSAATTLGGTPLVCGSIATLQGGYTRTADLGDGFFRLLPSSAASIAAVVAAPAGAQVRVPAGDLDGANVFLASYLARNVGANVSYAIGRVPAAVAAQGPLAALEYAFHTWGWDCVLSGVIQTPDKMTALPFFTPTQRYTLAMVSAKVVAALGSRTPPLSAWSQPFENSIWAILGGVLVFSGGLMYGFEKAGHSHEDFGPEYIHWSDRLGRGVYKATSNWTAVGSFVPTTPAGRLYSMTFAFVMLLMQSAYTANLAAFFTFTPPPTAKLSSVDKLIASGAPACVAGGDPVHAGWMASNYPEIAQVATPGFGADVAEAVETGRCLAGIATDAELNFALGPTGDPAGAWCELDVVESGLGFNMYAIPLNPASPWATPALLRAANSVLQTALATGEYSVEAMTQFGGTRRPVCENKESIYEQLTSTRAALAPLSTRQLGGIFFLQVCGLAVACFIYAVGHVTPLSRAWDAVRGITHDAGEDDPATSAEAGLKHDHRGRRIIPLSAMLNIERALELALVQLNNVAQTHRELDVPAIMAAHGGGAAAAGPAARNAEIANAVPLTVKAKIERALAFGMHARGDLVLFDSASGAELLSLPFTLPTAEALAIAYAHMPSHEAQDFEAVLTLFLKNSISERRKAARRLASGRATER